MIATLRKPPPRPKSLSPFSTWIAWGWYGLFQRGHAINQLFVFCCVGTSGVLVNYLVMLTLFRLFAWPVIAASVGAFQVAFTSNFLLNKYLTFQDCRWDLATAGSQYFKALCVALPSLVINELVLVGLWKGFGMDEVLANLVGVLAATVTNFLGNKFYAFKK